MSKLILVGILGLFLQGCVTNYAGRLPDLNATGTAAEVELKEFTLEDPGYWDAGPWLAMGPEKQKYTLESMRPVVGAVSSESAERLEHAIHIRKLQFWALGVGIAGLIAGFATQNDDQATAFFRVSIAGSMTSLGIGLYGASTLAAIPGPYNRDLKSKLAPTVGMNWDF